MKITLENSLFLKLEINENFYINHENKLAKKSSKQKSLKKMKSDKLLMSYMKNYISLEFKILRFIF